ncbi:MAG: hypothetical protein DCC58_07055 [Chloroflexi bacterium]|nr:MAG: hypothetical protein DCC58_07055 [Chloroflexota bacterium]
MRNLLGRLLERSPEELERIAAFWGIELRGRDRHADVSSLYRSMTDIWTARDAWERIDARGRRLISAMHTHRNGLTVSQAAEITGLGPPDAQQALAALYDAGIASIEARDDPTAPALFFLPREIDAVFGRVESEQSGPALTGLTLEGLLATATYQELEDAANAWGARVVPALHPRGELVGIVREQLSRPERVERYVANLSQQARTAFAHLKRAGGVVALDELLSPEDLPLAVRRRILRELATPLLLWHGYSTETPARRLALLPRSVLQPEPEEAVPVPELREVDNAEVEQALWVFPYAAAWDLLTILRDVVNGQPRWRALVESDPAILRRLRRRLWRADPETFDVPTGYVGFLARIGGMIGVLREADERAIAGDAAARWRESSFAAATQRMVGAWIAAEDWIEGRERVDASMWGAAWPAIRDTLIRALGDLPEERWFDEASFIDRLLRTEPELLRQAQIAAVGGRRGRNTLDTAADVLERRSQVLRLVLGTTLETACVWLGLIERGHQRTTDAPTLRVTPFGRWIAGRRVEPSNQSIGPAALAVGANFQVLLYRPTPRRVWALSSFADLESLDRVSTYSLTAQALIRSLAGGVDLAQVIAFLERSSGKPLPQNVAYTLAEWDRGYRRVWLRRAVVLAPEEGEEPGPIVAALREAGLEPEVLGDGRIALIYDEPEAGERLYSAAGRALRERGFAPLTDPHARSPRRAR